MTRLRLGAALSIPLQRAKLKQLVLHSRDVGNETYARDQTYVREWLALVELAAKESGL
jgi:hypothetical protein